MRREYLKYLKFKQNEQKLKLKKEELRNQKSKQTNLTKKT